MLKREDLSFSREPTNSAVRFWTTLDLSKNQEDENLLLNAGMKSSCGIFHFTKLQLKIIGRIVDELFKILEKSMPLVNRKHFEFRNIGTASIDSHFYFAISPKLHSLLLQVRDEPFQRCVTF